VVTSGRASLAEVAGAAAVLVDPLDSAAIADGIRQALDTGGNLREAGRTHVSRFRWEAAAESLLERYRMVGNGA
jgi:glycosyltransferase involved in cell wall biosynthesis